MEASRLMFLKCIIAFLLRQVQANVIPEITFNYDIWSNFQDQKTSPAEEEEDETQTNEDQNQYIFPLEKFDYFPRTMEQFSNFSFKPQLSLPMLELSESPKLSDDEFNLHMEDDLFPDIEKGAEQIGFDVSQAFSSVMQGLREDSIMQDFGKKKEDLKGVCQKYIPGISNTTSKNKELVYTNFQSRVVKKLRAIAKKHNCKLLWYDTDGRHAKDSNDPKVKELQRYKITPFSGPTYYGRPTECREQTDVILKNFSLCNSDPTKEMSIQPPPQSIEHESVVSWFLEQGLKISDRLVNFDAYVPSYMQSVVPTTAKTINAAPTDSNGKAETSVKVKESYAIQHNFTVDPMTTLILRYSSAKEEVELPFSAEVILEGYVMAMFDQDIDGKKLHVFPVTDFGGKEFKVAGNLLVFNCTGIFVGARCTSTEVYYSEMPYTPESKCDYP